MTDKKLEVFQDLNLRTRSAGVSIREAILAHVKAPWRHDPEREENAKSLAFRGEDVIALVRSEFDGIDESALVLWQVDDGYRVANIVPRNVGELGIAKYNAILQDFVERIAAPAAKQAGFQIDLTSGLQTIDDWLAPDAAATLQRFSHLANKSTGAGHPKDQERWYAFLISAHRTSSHVDPERLARWLTEVEGWSPETAHELAIDYEFALGLLEQYDLSRPA